jgi:hypothetical protein
MSEEVHTGGAPNILARENSASPPIRHYIDLVPFFAKGASVFVAVFKPIPGLAVLSPRHRRHGSRSEGTRAEYGNPQDLPASSKG